MRLRPQSAILVFSTFLLMPAAHAGTIDFTLSGGDSASIAIMVSAGTVTSIAGTFDGSTRALILQALRATGWIIGGPDGAAARLGLKRTTLIAKMRKLAISRPVRKNDIDRISESRECEPWLQPTTE